VQKFSLKTLQDKQEPLLKSTDAKSFEELLDEASLSSFHIIMICFCGFAWLCDGLEIAQYSFLFPKVESEFQLTKFDLGLLASTRSILSALGALILGYYAEYVGTRKMFMLSAFIYASFSLMAAFSTDYWTLLVTMAVAGFGAGGNIPLAITYIREFFPSRYRDPVIVMMHFWLQCGIASASGIDWVLGENWRGFLICTASPAAIIFLFFVFTEEKPQYLLAHGQIERVRSLLRLMGVEEESVVRLQATPSSENISMSKSLDGMYGKITIHAFIWTFVAMTAATQVWLPEIYENVLFVPSTTFHTMYMVFPLFSAVGFVTIALTVKHVDATKLLVWLLIVGVAVSAGFVAILMFGWPSIFFITAHCLYVIPATCVWSIAAVVTMSSFPSETLSFVMGICAAAKNVGAIISPTLSGLIMDHTSTEIGFSSVQWTGRFLALIAAMQLSSSVKKIPDF